MQLSKIGEFGLIRKLRARCPRFSSEIFAGIGDDAAAVQIRNGYTLITTDMMIEGVHFDLTLSTYFQLGFKFLTVNISDIFAMGGTPKYFFVSLGIPKYCSIADIKKIYSGIIKAARKYNISVVGGDTSASKTALVLSGTLIGSTNRIIKRSGSKEGDGIFISNTLGDSAMGLKLLKKRGKRINRFLPATPGMKLMKKHLMPQVAPLKNTAKITSMIDVSDGLLIDLSHICDESNVGAMLYHEKIPLSPEIIIEAKKLKTDPFEFAFKGGEDYALLFTAPLNIKTDAFRIGEIIKKGRYIVNKKGGKKRFKPEGYEHFKTKGSRGQGIKDSSV